MKKRKSKPFYSYAAPIDIGDKDWVGGRPFRLWPTQKVGNDCSNNRELADKIDAMCAPKGL